MEARNPFSRAKRERKVVDAGIYSAVLVGVKAVQVADKKNPGQKIDKIVVSFYVGEKDVDIAQFFTPSLADTSHIVKFLKVACGDAFTPAIQGDPDKMWEFVNSLVGKEFTIVVTLSNGWNNIQSAMQAKPPFVPGVPTAMTDDFAKIPF